jgi:glycosyltransferase involved in cell wall biosynthesis
MVVNSHKLATFLGHWKPLRRLAIRSYLWIRGASRLVHKDGQWLTFSPELPLKQKTRVLLIAPGEMKMPAQGWGAVELLVWNQAAFFQSQGCEVAILNSWSFRDWLTAILWQPTVIVNHYDVFAFRSYMISRLTHRPLVSISHYADLDKQSRWDLFFEQYFHWFKKSEKIVALSPGIATFLRRSVNVDKVRVIPNGVPVKNFKGGESSSRLLYLGKVEPRKRQIETQLLGLDYQIDFVGQIVDERFHSLDIGAKRNFVGPWTRSEVFNNMHKYAAICLFSVTEGDALVLYEAQAAGLGVFVTDGALGSQSLDLPWVVRVEFEKTSIDEAIRDNLDLIRASRPQIRAHALEHFDERVCFEKWLMLIHEVQTRDH